MMPVLFVGAAASAMRVGAIGSRGIPLLATQRMLPRMLTTMSASPTVLVPIADDSEEIETACITDTLVRAGATVTVASVEPGRLQVKMSRGLKVVADVPIEDCASESWDCSVCTPGNRLALMMIPHPMLTAHMHGHARPLTTRSRASWRDAWC
jgi:hypothetical protein